jgi:cytochrome c-type biogenesis protein CcmH
MSARRSPLLAMLLAVLVAGFLVLGAAPAQAIDPTQLPDPKLETRYNTLLHELRCPVCQDESLADSPADAAGEMRAQVRKMLLEGKTDAQIRQYFVARYSEFILFKPEYSLRNAWLWLLPFALLAVGILVAVRILRARAALVDQDGADPDDQLGEPPRAGEAAHESEPARLSGPAHEGAARG